jgi:sulfopropanediol 3-dehydrogenase
VLVIADETADAQLIAADLLGQAEHGPTSPAVLATLSERLGIATIAACERQLRVLNTSDIAGLPWRDHGAVYVVDSVEEAFELSDEIAFEHVEVMRADPLYFLVVRKLNN